MRPEVPKNSLQPTSLRSAAEAQRSAAEGVAVDIVWDGITRAEVLHEEAVKIRHALADAAKSYNWPKAFELIAERPLRR